MAGTVLQMMVRNDDESVECSFCGILFASTVIPLRRKDGRNFFCPNGHVLSWSESEADKLRKELAQEKLNRQQAERGKEWAQVQKREAESAKLKVEKKLRLQTKRVNAGVCPHCQRTFQQLARHMQCKHKDIIKESEAS